MAPGDYIIQEYPPMGWNLFSIFITGDTDNGSSIDLSLNQAKLDYDSGEDIVVYFENLYEEQQEGVDFGDAPDSYRTRMISNGASHSVHHDISIGTLTDAEPDGLPTIAADGDDNADQNDEDGVLITAPFMPGSPGTAKIDVENRGAVDDYGYVVGWIDFNRDNSFQQTELIGSQYLTLTASSVTSHTFNFTVPANSIPGPTYARFRLFIGRQEQGVQFVPIWYDYGGDGEVEDYMVEIEGEQENLDWGDAPSPYPAASHTIAGAYIGGSAAPDAETGMQRHPQALGDDQDSDGDDEDGFQQFSDFVPGQLMHFVLVTTYPANDSVMAFLWIDWNQDKDWEDPGEAVLTFSYNASGSGKGYCVIGMIAQVPTYAVLGNTFARVRVARPEGPGFSSYGYMKSGEVEDHLVVVKSEGDSIPQGSMLFGYKWNDLNGNGIWDVAPTPEPPLPNWTIWLDMNSNGVYDSGDLTTTTDASGRYQFSNLADGSYVVGEQLQNGWTQTYPPAPGTHTVSVAVGQIVQAANFGNMQQEPGPGDGVLKWSQPPLFDPLWEDTTCYFGWDEPSIFMERMAADDWFCFNPQPVTSIRWWGSYTNWRQDLPPEQAPNMFHLSIWTDVPRDEENEFSHPGERIWELFMPRDAVNELPVRCDFFPDRMDEPETCFRYHINLPKDTWFYQEGDSTVYWLCVTAVYEQEPPEEHIWGWKTRMHYFNDDAVLFHSIESKDGQFVFEAGEPLAPRWDLAFELGTTEYEWNLDFGDAPDSRLCHNPHGQRRSSSGGPNVQIGELIDAESDGQPQSDAKGDDANHLNDADGVRFLTDFVPGETVEMQVDLSSAGYVNVWLDIHSFRTLVRSAFACH
ncbi:MAG: GEVED domain-containing protein [candidate division KSB1 bacterium]|nr:GEVED domain-containing protein [candidate division KSB1 bacterium]